jgi:BirA family biotin operon repressor/biotin-[acetyl-CoA-carboxylase] ligase
VIHTVAVTGSTNADLLALAASPSPPLEGDWLVADRQDRGRGRQGRSWSDGAGNFMGSTVVRLRPGDPPAPTLALVAGLALHAAVARYAVSATLKWPNDLLIGGAKLAGILLERAGDVVVAGFGVNLAAAPQVADRAVIALADVGQAPPRDAFALDLVDRFAAALQRWRGEPLAAVVADWCAAAHPVGTPLIAGGHEGAFAGLTPDGALQLRLADGQDRVIHAGEVMLAAERG